MSIAPDRLHSISADERNAHELKRRRRERLVRRLVEVAQDVHLAFAARARAMPAQVLQRDETLAPVVPSDSEFGADDLNVVWVHGERDPQPV